METKDDLDLAHSEYNNIIAQFFAEDIEVIKDTPIAQREVQVRKLAASMFMNFVDLEDQDHILFGPNEGVDSLEVREYVDKAEKLYSLWGDDLDSAKKFLNVLSVLDHRAAKQIVNKL